jgi:hypothetical protein
MPPSWRIIDPQIEKRPDGLVGPSSEAERGIAPLNALGHPAQFVVGRYDADGMSANSCELHYRSRKHFGMTMIRAN